jgi:hypothetical protein
MRRFLLILAGLALAFPAYADSTVPTLTAATTLVGSSTYLAQGGSTDTKLLFNTSVFDIAAGALILKAAGVTNTALANPSTTVNGQTCTLGSTCLVPGMGAAGGESAATVTNASTTIAAGHYIIKTTATNFTAQRTTTLPTAAAFGAHVIEITDLGGAINGANTWLIAPQGSDTINGVNSSVTLANQWAGMLLTSDGVSNWSIGGSIAGLACPPHQFATTLTNAGVWTCAQPNFTDISGQATLAQFPSIANNTALGNVSGGSAVPVALTTTQFTTLCNTFSSSLSGCAPSSGGGTTNFLRADGTWASPPGGSGGGTLNYSDNGVTVTANTYFIPPGGGGIPQTTEANVDVAAPAAATISHLSVGISVAPGAGNSYTFTFRDAGSDTALTCTISGASATSCVDNTHSVNIGAGDLIDWKLVSAGTIITTPTVTITAALGTSGVGVTSVTCGTGLSGGTITTTGTCSLASANPAFLDVNQAWTKGQAVTPFALTDAATIAVDASQSNGFTVTLGGNRTLGNPSNTKAGQWYNFALTQDGTGSRTLAYGSDYKFAGGTAPTLTTTAAAVDILSCWAYQATVLACQLLANVK